MKRVILFIIPLFLLVLTLPSLATEKSTDKITEITLASESWENATNKDGTGMYWDLFRAIYEPMDITVIIKIRSYAGSIEMVKNKKADAMVAAALNEIEEFNYPKWHFDTENVTALFKKDKTWKNAESMKGKKVAFIKDYGYDEYFDFPVVVKEFDNRNSILRVLDKGRVDYWIDAKEDIEDFFKKTSIDATPYRMEIIQSLKLYLGFAGTERGKKLADIFDRQFEKLLESGEIQKIHDKWKQGKFKL